MSEAASRATAAIVWALSLDPSEVYELEATHNAMKKLPPDVIAEIGRQLANVAIVASVAPENTNG